MLLRGLSFIDIDAQKAVSQTLSTISTSCGLHQLRRSVLVKQQAALMAVSQYDMAAIYLSRSGAKSLNIISGSKRIFLYCLPVEEGRSRTFRNVWYAHLTKRLLSLQQHRCDSPPTLPALPLHRTSAPTGSCPVVLTLRQHRRTRHRWP